MKLISLTQGKFAQVDNSDYKLVSKFKWCVYKNHNSYYAKRTDCSNGKRVAVYMHRFIMGAPKNMQVGHIDGEVTV